MGGAKWLANDPKLQPQGPLSRAWMKIGGHMYHTQICKKVSWHQTGVYSAILNQTAIFGNLHVVYFNELLLGILLDSHENHCVCLDPFGMKS